MLRSQFSCQQFGRRHLDVAHPHVGRLRSALNGRFRSLLALVVELDLVRVNARLFLLCVLFLLVLVGLALFGDLEVLLGVGPVGAAL
ncbi:hypothetical protein N185_13020 [Sinorhizobium sp. GW3]|nr:hypothetical protein N185_13020 [Sinorhizobium sp. GW3]